MPEQKNEHSVTFYPETLMTLREPAGPSKSVESLSLCIGGRSKNGDRVTLCADHVQLGSALGKALRQPLTADHPVYKLFPNYRYGLSLEISSTEDANLDHSTFVPKTKNASPVTMKLEPSRPECVQMDFARGKKCSLDLNALELRIAEHEKKK